MNQLQKTAGVFTGALFATGAALAEGPSAGSLASLTPDVATILTAIGAVGVVILGVTLAIKGFDIVRRMTKKVG
ncbi:MAG: hypothetical protein ACK5AZ_27340 [Bryobacteraceae bacterium]